MGAARKIIFRVIAKLKKSGIELVEEMASIGVKGKRQIATIHLEEKDSAGTKRTSLLF